MIIEFNPSNHLWVLWCYIIELHSLNSRTQQRQRRDEPTTYMHLADVSFNQLAKLHFKYYQTVERSEFLVCKRKASL